MAKQCRLKLESGDVEIVNEKVVHHIDMRVSPTFLEMFNEIKSRYEKEYGRKLSKSEVMRICIDRTCKDHGINLEEVE